MADGLGAAAEALAAAWQRLGQRWQETASVWDDSVRRQFEAEFLGPMEAEVPATLMAMGRLAEVIAGARREVE